MRNRCLHHRGRPPTLPFQSSCEATGLRNAYSWHVRPPHHGVSILLRGNGVAQLVLAATQNFSSHSFNPLARQRGCATEKTGNSETGERQRFNPLARQRGCATEIDLLLQERKIRFNPLARQRGCATFIIVVITIECVIGFNPLARQRGCATGIF